MCDIIKDMLPLYVDNLCGEETRHLVEKHVESCRECREVLEVMKSGPIPQFVVKQQELAKEKAPFKKIRSRVILLCFGLVLLTAAATQVIPPFYYELTREKYNIEISSNIYDIDFAELAEKLASTVNADKGMLYNFMGFPLFDVGRNGDILRFNTSFIIFRDDKPLHFETSYIKENQLRVRRTWDFELTKEEAAAKYMELPLVLLDRIPWEHLIENLITTHYDYLTISNIRNRDGQGNILVGAGIPKSFFVNERGEISNFEELTFLPSWEYQVINFTPMLNQVNKSARGRMEVQYFLM